MARILVIDDEENLRLTISRSLSRQKDALTGRPHHVAPASTLDEARRLIGEGEFDIVITDVMLGPGASGLDFAREIRGDGFEGVVVVMTAYGRVEDAVRAVRDGADDYLVKPLSLEELGLQVDKWLEHRRLERRARLYERLESSKAASLEIIGRSPAWLDAVRTAERLASVPLPDVAPARTPAVPDPVAPSLPCILLTGETGVGKGVLARHIHATAVKLGASAPNAPFVHVNASALPANLVEGELFGHERGAFTDAREARPGLFEMADGGTIFLDEIGEMPLDLQAKLLLAVEQGTFRRVGGTRERRVRVRVIAASNQELPERAKAGQFRRDLLYRLSAFTIRIPPLREREDDAVLLAESALERLSRRYGREGARLSDAARAALRAHDWPGNVRELVNAVQRGVMLADGTEIRPLDLGLAPAALLAEPAFHSDAPVNAHADPLAHADDSAPSELRFDFGAGPHTVSDVERLLIVQALQFTHGNVSRAARLIGMQRSSMRHRIERYKLDRLVTEAAGR
jgi:two-component system, NtrC family, response regulator AtoC